MGMDSGNLLGGFTHGIFSYTAFCGLADQDLKIILSAFTKVGKAF
jgi:hypothetical protein